jgi:molybdenum-dependent DNA-binding transcriptional regulator ModE
MQKKVKITIAPLWGCVVNFFQADGISRMRNKMENGMNTVTEKARELIKQYPALKEQIVELLSMAREEYYDEFKGEAEVLDSFNQGFRDVLEESE